MVARLSETYQVPIPIIIQRSYYNMPFTLYKNKNKILCPTTLISLLILSSTAMDIHLSHYYELIPSTINRSHVQSMQQPQTKSLTLGFSANTNQDIPEYNPNMVLIFPIVLRYYILNFSLNLFSLVSETETP